MHRARDRHRADGAPRSNHKRLAHRMAGIESIRPFEGFTRRINEIRANAKPASDMVKATTAKEIGNTSYGKTAQAVASRRVTRTTWSSGGRSIRNGASRTCSGPAQSASQCCRLLHRSGSGRVMRSALAPPESAWAASATTDGFLFAGSEVDSTSRARLPGLSPGQGRISPDKPNVWEVNTSFLARS